MSRRDFKRPSNVIKGKKATHWHDAPKEYTGHEKMVNDFLKKAYRKKPKKGDRCRACDGYGYIKEDREPRRSAGTTPCNKCEGTGKIQ